MVLVERLVDRKAEIMESLLVRIGTAREEMKHVKNFDYVVVNAKGKLDNAVKLMESIIDARKLGFVRGLLSYNGQSTCEAGKKLYSLIALSLNMDEDFFDKIGAVDKPSAFLRLLRYPPGEMGPHQEICSAHSDTGALTLLLTDGVLGLQIEVDQRIKHSFTYHDSIIL
ncbi:hypothetical protein JHK87_022157 [Glycine soja]|nr:hypothetical protein JHK87_022157 [Glycine soja]